MICRTLQETPNLDSEKSIMLHLTKSKKCTAQNDTFIPYQPFSESVYIKSHYFL